MLITEINNINKRKAICNNILRDLPDWFGQENGILNYVKLCENKNNFFISASINDNFVGFALVSLVKPCVYEIVVMGVLNNFRRNGIGTDIMNFIFNRLKGSYLLIRTVDKTKENDVYKTTREFYSKVGFHPIITLNEVWGEENPCLIMIKKI